MSILDDVVALKDCAGSWMLMIKPSSLWSKARLAWTNVRGPQRKASHNAITRAILVDYTDNARRNDYKYFLLSLAMPVDEAYSNSLPTLGACLRAASMPADVIAPFDTAPTVISTAQALSAQATFPQQLALMPIGQLLPLPDQDLEPLWQQGWQLQAVFESKQPVQLGLLQRLQGQSKRRPQYGVSPSRSHPPSSIYPLPRSYSPPPTCSPTPAPANQARVLETHRFVSDAGVVAAEHLQNLIWNQTELIMAGRRAIQPLPTASSPRQVRVAPSGLTLRI
jgi:hypothetical protein